MYVQGVENVYDLDFNGRAAVQHYGDVFLQAEREYSAYNFEVADTDIAVPPLRRRRGGVPAR